MKSYRISLIIIFLSSVQLLSAQSTQTVAPANPQQNKFMIMTVTHDILDCPHFGMLIPKMLRKSLSSEVVETRPKDRYMVVKINNTTLNEEEYKTKFLFMLDSVHFPKTSLKEISFSDKAPASNK